MTERSEGPQVRKGGTRRRGVAMTEHATDAERDALTAHDLRQRGSLKWTMFDRDIIGAFVAEMDFGTAPPVTAALQEAVAAASFGYLPPWQAVELAQACAQWQRQRYG